MDGESEIRSVEDLEANLADVMLQQVAKLLRHFH